MATMANGNGSSLLLLGTPDGVPVIPAQGELTRLNYFDGKFLRAADLTAEQDYLRRLIQFGNQAGGSGVIAGYDTVRSTRGDAIDVSPGLAMDGQGRILQLPIAQSLDAGPLIAASNAAQPSAIGSAQGAADFADCVAPATGPTVVPSQTADLYLLTVGYTEALCGEENVYGKLCEDACAKDVDRRWRVEGVIFRARPLALITPLIISKAVLLEAKHLRSRAASAYYADERARVPSLISGAGLRADTWCLGASAELGGDVPLAVFSRSGGGIHFVDAWIARRERMEAPPRRYWAWRMSMRPWPAYLAQILQFQCELHDIFTDGGGPAPVDPCAPAKTALSEASVLLARLETFHASLATNLSSIQNQLPQDLKLSLFDGGLAEIGAVKNAVLAAAAGGPASDRVLIDGGFVELPPAGYLPVTAGAPETVNSQVRRLVGPGLDLRFCIVRPDYIPHALEMRQHMERISLLDGLVDMKSRPEVDILVPNGRATQSVSLAKGQEFKVTIPSAVLGQGSTKTALFTFATSLEGAARWTGKDSAQGGTSGGELVFAVMADAANVAALPGIANPPPKSTAAYALLSFDSDPFAASVGSSISVFASADVATGQFANASLRGTFTVRNVSNEAATSAIVVMGQLQALYGTGGNAPTVSKSGGSLVLDLVLAKRFSGVQTIITAREARSLALLQWTWDDSRQTGTLSQITPTLVSGALTNATNPNRTLAVLEEQDDILETANRWNDDVVRALDTIEPRTDEPTAWRAAANAKLWPVPPTGSELDILATLDWVLFCRRRTESCNHEVAPAPAKRFQVWAIEIGAAGWTDAVKAKIIANPAAFKPQQVDVVEFAAQGYALSDGIGAITRWLNFNKKPYNQVLWAGIGMKTSPDPDSLELNRATAYESVLSSTGMTIASMREVLPTLAPPLAVPGAEGSILLVVAVKPLEQVNVFLAQHADADQNALAQATPTGQVTLDSSRFNQLVSVPLNPDGVTAAVAFGKTAGSAIAAIQSLVPAPKASAEEIGWLASLASSMSVKNPTPKQLANAGAQSALQVVLFPYARMKIYLAKDWPGSVSSTSKIASLLSKVGAVSSGIALFIPGDPAVALTATQETSPKLIPNTTLPANTAFSVHIYYGAQLAPLAQPPTASDWQPDAIEKLLLARVGSTVAAMQVPLHDVTVESHDEAAIYGDAETIAVFVRA